MDNQKKKPQRWKRTVLIVLLVILSVILVVLASAAIYANYLLSKIEYAPKVESTMSQQEASKHDETDPGLETIHPSDGTLPNIETITFPTKPLDKPEEEYHKDPNVINILLIGQDARPGESRARSDAMILATFNKNSGQITLTSFMRDSYVQIPGYKPNKLNAAFQYGGFSLLNETLRVNFGVEVDGNVEIDFSGFENLIDLLGGVNIKLTEKETNYLNEKYVWNMESGYQTLNGEEALAYSRIRHIDSDYRRAERQRKVLLSLIDAYKNQPILDMIGLLDDILPLVRTNMDKGEIVGLVWDLFPMLSKAEFKTNRIPADGTFESGNVQVRPGLKNWFQYHIDFEANEKILQKIFDEGRDD